MSDNRKWAIVIEKNVIKKFAIEARRELLSRVSQRALRYGISDQEVGNPNDDSVGGHLLSSTEKSQRAALIKQIQEKGYEQVMEEVAYTWFNRFSALRFMEVNGFLPTRVRVFTDENNAFKPQILTEAIHMELDGLDMEKVYAYKEANDNDELYKYLLIIQCNALNSVLPGMFQKIADYTELLFPDNLLREGSVVQQMVTLIPEDDWKNAVQIIGWLYQYYNSELKTAVDKKVKGGGKVSKEEVPAKTQLFTPDWIVRYMVENSLGRLWLEGHPNDDLKGQWKYYLEEAKQEPEVQAQLDAIREEYKALKPEDIRCIDPCSGSGHILAYMFDVLVQIYEAYGVDTRTAVKSIVENNLYGLDIDDRAAQLSYFAVMMKACQYDKRFLKRRDENGNPKIPQPKVFPILESGCVDKAGNTRFKFDKNVLDYFSNGDEHLREAIGTIIKELFNAKEYGSILTITPQDWSALYDRFAEITEDINMSRETALRELLPLVQVAEALMQKYNVVVTNPPYMGSNNMGITLSSFVKTNYPNSKSDMSTVFMELCQHRCKHNGMYAMINIPVWMTQSSFLALRRNLLGSATFVNMLHLGRGVFGSDFGTTAFVIRSGLEKDYTATYRRLFEGLTQVDSIDVKENWFFEGKGIYHAKQHLYDKIDGLPIAYWVTRGQVAAFDFPALNTLAEPRQGFATGDNERFLRFWQEVDFSHACFSCKNRDEAKQSEKRWFPCNKGGAFRRWYGNNERFVNWENDGAEMIDFSGSVIRNPSYYFRQGMTWSTATMSKLSMRYSPVGFLFESKGSVCFPIDDRNLSYLLALLNTKIVEKLLLVLAPTVDYHEGPLGRIPVIVSKEHFAEVSRLSEECVSLARYDWDSFETSWDFQRHPLLQYASFTPQMVAKEEANGYLTMNGIADAYRHWEQVCNERFNQLKANEEELNRIFIDIYGLQEELTPEVEDKDVTVRKADLDRDIRSFISYAVGCMFGRYSLYKPGLIYAGGDWDSVYGDFPIEKISLNENVAHGAGFHTYGAPIVDKAVVYLKEPTEMQDAEEFWGVDADNIIPISDDEYFEDDIVGRFVEFVRIVYGTETLDENLQFIADALGGKGTPKEVIRNYFLTKFYADHCKMYQKRPIYWLFDSGKKNGFKALIYMHRYQPDTIARIRTDYVHEQQARYRTAIADLEQRIANAATGERVKLNKQLKKLNDQAAEILAYEEKIHHLADQMIPIDLDDGVKVNYAKFQDVLAKIK